MILTNSQRKELNDLVSNNLVKGRKHPTLPLTVYKYSKELQYKIKFDLNDNYSEKPDDFKWTTLLSMCRGLVIEDETNKIIAKGFSKFFNASEHGFEHIQNRMKRLKYNIYEKLDGSLIVLFNYNGEWVTSTNGSFDSEQSLLSKKLLTDEMLNTLDKDYIYLLEYISPLNKIVINYESEELILLAILNRKNNFSEISLDSKLNKSCFKKVEKVKIKENLLSNLQSITFLNIPNKEGFVIVFEDGFRVKLKFEEYVRLHKIKTELSDKSILLFLSEGSSVIEKLKDIPDELHTWIYKTELKFKKWYSRYYNYSKLVYEKFSSIEDQKEFSKKVSSKLHSNLIFNIRNNKSERNDNLIWKLVEDKRKKISRNKPEFFKDV